MQMCGLSSFRIGSFSWRCLMREIKRTDKVYIRNMQKLFGDADMRSIVNLWLAPAMAQQILIDHSPGPSTGRKLKRQGPVPTKHDDATNPEGIDQAYFRR
jgi:hypothetical protein